MRECWICGETERAQDLSECDYCGRPVCTFECCNEYEDESGKSLYLCDKCDEKERAKRRRIAEAHDIIEQLAAAGIELDDERLSYMTIQVDRDLIERAKKWLEGGE